MNTSSDMRAGGVARDIFTGEFCSDIRRDGVSSLSGDSLLEVTRAGKKIKGGHLSTQDFSN